MPHDRDPNWNPAKMRAMHSSELRASLRNLSLPYYQRQAIQKALSDAEPREADQAASEQAAREREANEIARSQAVSASDANRLAAEANAIARSAMQSSRRANGIAWFSLFIASAGVIVAWIGG